MAKSAQKEDEDYYKFKITEQGVIIVTPKKLNAPSNKMFSK